MRALGRVGRGIEYHGDGDGEACQDLLSERGSK